ncbi:DUF572-domain-containing protein [Coprinopsis marcescibilis]|uniref:DUF572-domain-containing protein n=1 Tax=Coprinopsis marcescibilis TaxID=230819 RepID=A0A5C3LI12_COPMA|nr:DUF572-domain-containing protein [Coprinopsis marcescibilis]
MQGFNKYYPPDWDPSKGGLNKFRGTHALGDRARKLDQGILITRFELPFNIWCGTCNNHIGMGVRYNAEKKKIGNYLSTPIYSFRCKCHLCDGWFEIQTDPKNTQYVVTSGARRKDEDWDPEQNGGFAIHDTDKEGVAVDPLVALEKTAGAEKMLNEVHKPRIEALQGLSDHYNSDPYSLSVKARHKFRQEKKVEQTKRKAEDELKGRYGLPSTLKLVEEDDRAKEEAHAQWLKGKQDLALQGNAKRRKLALDVVSFPTSSSAASSSKRPDPVSSLKARVLQNTAARHSSSIFGSIASTSTRPKG